MENPERTPTGDFASGLEKHLKDASNVVSFRTHTYTGNDISYFPKHEGQEIEVNSLFSKKGTYRLTISQNGTVSKIRLGIKYLKNRPLEPDWKAILKQNMKELKIFLSRA